MSLVVSACGGGSSSTPTSPSTPNTSAPPQNHVPSLSAATVNPTFGVQDHTTFTFNAAATDPDGDPLTYSWSIAGNSASGQMTQMGFRAGGEGTASVTVSDGRGGTATGNVAFIVGTITGRWTGSLMGMGFTMDMTQVNGQVFNGTWQSPIGNGSAGPTGEPGRINASGAGRLPVKVAPYTDFVFTGQMDGTGRQINGTVQGSGFTGQSMVIAK